MMTSAEHNLAERIRGAIELANREVYRQYSARGGTTIAVVVFSGPEVVGARAGAVGCTPTAKEEWLRQVSVDDTIAVFSSAGLNSRHTSNDGRLKDAHFSGRSFTARFAVRVWISQGYGSARRLCGREWITGGGSLVLEILLENLDGIGVGALLVFQADLRSDQT
jgi:hypothetical protein